MRVTVSFLSLLKVKPMLGRDFQPDEEKRGANNVVIVSHQFWQNRLGGNASAVGNELTLDGKPSRFRAFGAIPLALAVVFRAVGTVWSVSTVDFFRSQA